MTARKKVRRGATELGEEHYRPEQVRALFDEMAASYDLMNTVTSFGFCVRWRRQALASLRLQPGAHIADLMCGMGENWTAMKHAAGGKLTITGVDFSAVMCAGARARAGHQENLSITVMKSDATCTSLTEGSCDAVVCSFGLKTLAPAQVLSLAREVRRLLRPGGTFSLVEVSVPAPLLLRLPYLWHIGSGTSAA